MAGGALALSGTVVNISMSVAKFDRFEDLEDHVVDYLASVTDLKVFGCTIDFLQVATQTYLENPVCSRAWSTVSSFVIAAKSSPHRNAWKGVPSTTFRLLSMSP